jgi:tetratricopeptide (TPR) repeat protein
MLNVDVRSKEIFDMFSLGRILIIPALIVATVTLCGCTSLAKLGAVQQIQEYRDEGRFEKALNEADAAAGFCSDSLFQAEIAFLKAECLEQMGKKEEAKELYQFLIDQCSTSHYSYQARARLKTLEERNAKEQ